MGGRQVPNVVDIVDGINGFRRDDIYRSRQVQLTVSENRSREEIIRSPTANGLQSSLRRALLGDNLHLCILSIVSDLAYGELKGYECNCACYSNEFGFCDVWEIIGTLLNPLPLIAIYLLQACSYTSKLKLRGTRLDILRTVRYCSQARFV